MDESGQMSWGMITVKFDRNKLDWILRAISQTRSKTSAPPPS